MKYLLPLTLILLITPALADPPTNAFTPQASGTCPMGVVSCKIVAITPDEERTLTQPGGIFDQALWANRSGMEGLISAWKQKLITSPAGTVPEPSKKDEPKQ